MTVAGSSGARAQGPGFARAGLGDTGFAGRDRADPALDSAGFAHGDATDSATAVPDTAGAPATDPVGGADRDPADAGEQRPGAERLGAGAEGPGAEGPGGDGPGAGAGGAGEDPDAQGAGGAAGAEGAGAEGADAEGADAEGVGGADAGLATGITLGPAGDAQGEGSGLSGRLTAIARMVQIGSARRSADGFSPELLWDAEELLARAGERLRMSGGHSVVVLAGGTGSGKSSVFNRLAGADLSPAGVVRPMTRRPYACVWGMEGAGPLLDWLGVDRRNRYARSSALDEGERSLAGLLLLDLPDHDSVLADAEGGEVSRLMSLADLMVWVLDPQKYADASVHSRYLVPMAGHTEVIAVVLNQADLLTPDQVHDCVSDLQRLLDSEGLHDVRVVVTSALTGAGIGDLRTLLVETVLARQAATERIMADVEALAARFAVYADGPRSGASDVSADGGGSGAASDRAGAHGDREGGSGTLSGAGGSRTASDSTSSNAAGDRGNSEAARPGTSTTGSPVGPTGGTNVPGEDKLTDAFARAAGVSGMGRALQSARELRAVDYIGWPVSWFMNRLLRRDPVRKMRLGSLWDELRGLQAGPAGAQAAEVDNAVTGFADVRGTGLPAPWPARVRSAARSRFTDLPAELGAAVAKSLPPENRVSPWWRIVAAWQGILLGAAVTGLAWLGVLLAIGVFHAVPHAATLFSDVALLPWAGLAVAAAGLLGWLTGLAGMSIAARAADRERRQAERQMRVEIAATARQLVIMPVEQELSEYQRFREELAVARGMG